MGALGAMGGMAAGTMTGMDHGEGENSAMGGMNDSGMSGMSHGKGGQSGMGGMNDGAMSGMNHGGGGHDAMAGMAGMGVGDPGPVVARHEPGGHGPGNLNVAEVQRDRLGERGTGLEAVDHRVLTYSQLRNVKPMRDRRPPSRTIELHLTGNMERYIWSFDGVKYSDAAPIDIVLGDRIRLILVNDTMMEHPIHLHGMFMELENDQGDYLPFKHTISVLPASRASLLITVDEPGRWAFHCHMLYHMEAGMFRVVRVAPAEAFDHV